MQGLDVAKEQGIVLDFNADENTLQTQSYITDIDENTKCATKVDVQNDDRESSTCETSTEDIEEIANSIQGIIKKYTNSVFKNKL